MTVWALQLRTQDSTGSTGLGDAVRSLIPNNDRMYEGPRYCLLLQMITCGSSKPLPAYAWIQKKVMELMKPDLELTQAVLLDLNQAVLDCGRPELS